MEVRISVIKRQFLQALPINKIEFEEIFKDLNWTDQEKLLRSTVLHELNIAYPLRVEYQILFIKHCISQLESNGNIEIHDLFYESLAEKLTETRPEFSYKHFVVNCEPDQRVEKFTIKESNSIVKDGTTGLKMWPAAIKLCDFIVQNPHIFKGRSVLELGSGGSGFVGLTLLTFCQPKKVFLSDCHESVIESLIDNVTLNTKKLQFEEESRSLLISHRIKSEVDFAILNLPWEEIDKHENELKSLILPDILLAADIVYDDNIFEALFKCITKIFILSSPALTFFLSQSIRNQTTYQKFSQRLLASGFNIDDPEPVSDFGGVFEVDSDSEIKIIKISKTQATTPTDHMDSKNERGFIFKNSVETV